MIDNYSCIILKQVLMKQLPADYTPEQVARDVFALVDAMMVERKKRFRKNPNGNGAPQA